MANTRQFSTFIVDGYFFGIEVTQVQEVISYQEMTSVPLADSVVRGLINLRGQIVLAIDMRHRLDLSARSDDSKPMNVIVNTDDGPISLLVDEIGDVLEVDESTMEEPPENLKGRASSLISGIYKLKEKLLLSLDLEKIVHFSAVGTEAN